MTNDTLLKEAVLAELLWEPSIKEAHIGVTARNGVITLMGHVDTYAQKHNAEIAVRRVRGVKAIAEELEVKLPYDIKRSDEDIAAAILSRFAWDATIPANTVKAIVQDGWITLTGEVDWHYQHDAAATEIRSLWGVVGITNEIKVKTRVDTATIRDDINHALHRTWVDPLNISITADGGRVKLSGTVHSWSDRLTSGSTAWAAPGVTVVENDLMVA